MATAMQKAPTAGAGGVVVANPIPAESEIPADEIGAIIRFDEPGVEDTYNEAMSLYPIAEVTSKLVVPLLRELGRRWETAEGSVAEEHFFSVYLRNKLGARFHHRPTLPAAAPRLLAACVPGEHHEIGLLLFALAAHEAGLRVVLLGADVPLGEEFVVGELPPQRRQSMPEVDPLTVLRASDRFFLVDSAAGDRKRDCPVRTGVLWQTLGARPGGAAQ